MLTALLTLSIPFLVGCVVTWLWLTQLKPLVTAWLTSHNL